MKSMCHAYGCTADVNTLAFCSKDWAALPKSLQLAIWKSYRRGQEKSGAGPTARFELVVALAVGVLAFDTGKLTLDQARTLVKRRCEFCGPRVTTEDRAFFDKLTEQVRQELHVAAGRIEHRGRPHAAPGAK